MIYDRDFSFIYRFGNSHPQQINLKDARPLATDPQITQTLWGTKLFFCHLRRASYQRLKSYDGMLQFNDFDLTRFLKLCCSFSGRHFHYLRTRSRTIINFWKSIVGHFVDVVSPGSSYGSKPAQNAMD